MRHADPEQSDRFLSTAGAELTISFAKERGDARPLELVNKTNQFNLNGRRYLEGEWQRRLDDPSTFLMVAGYEDKYGPLGRIAVLAGRRREDGAVSLDTWVMSCRAFARRIEFRCLQIIFEKFDVDELEVEFELTPKNGPARTLLAEFIDDLDSARPLRLSRQTFAARCPALYHRVKELPA